MRRHLQRERGQTIAMFALALIPMLGAVALAVDGGMFVYQRTNLQKAADGAVLAGIHELRCTNDAARLTSAETIATEYAYLNTSDVDEVAITVQPTTVTAEVANTFPSAFARAVGITSFTAKARAVATAWCNSGAFGIIALNPTECAALDLNGDYSANVINGDVIVNSNCQPNAIDVEGSGGSLQADGVYTYGDWNDPHGTISPPPRFLPPVPDPYATVDTPDTSPSPTYTDCSWGGGGTPPPPVPPGTYDCPTGFVISGSQPVVFEGGVYAFRGGMVIQGNGQPVTFGRGTYSFLADSGEGFAYTGGRSIDASLGALFYNTCGDGACGTWSAAALQCLSTETSGRFYLAGGSSFYATPVFTYDGKYFANLTFFQDRCSTTEMEFAGTSLQLVINPTGGIYGKSAHFDFAGTANGSLQMVADTIELRGTVDMSVDVWGGQPVEIVAGWMLTE